MFFVSRTSGDDDGYALRFFQDLLIKVAEISESGDAVGFVEIDENRSGPRSSEWTERAWRALSTCQVFVALCSSRYFLDERCGREWWVFSERCRRHEQMTSRAAPVLLPVLWAETHPPWDDWVDTTDGPAVQTLMQLRRFKERYERFVFSTASRIVELTGEYQIPELGQDVDPRTVPNAFAPGRSVPPGGDVPLARAGRSQWVHFVVAAASRPEMAGIRDDLQYYGEHGTDWAPYRPDLLSSLARHAQQVAAGRLFESDIVDLEQASELEELARGHNEIVVLLVDSWITRVSTYRSALERCDELSDAPMAVLVAVSDVDVETIRNVADLHTRLREAMAHSLAGERRLTRMAVNDAESFDLDLVQVLEGAQYRIFNRGAVFRKPQDARCPGRPILRGP